MVVHHALTGALTSALAGALTGALAGGGVGIGLSYWLDYQTFGAQDPDYAQGTYLRVAVTSNDGATTYGLYRIENGKLVDDPRHARSPSQLGGLQICYDIYVWSLRVYCVAGGVVAGVGTALLAPASVVYAVPISAMACGALGYWRANKHLAKSFQSILLQTGTDATRVRSRPRPTHRTQGGKTTPRRDAS